MTSKTVLTVVLSLWILLGATASAGSFAEFDDWTDDKIRIAFDETARNFGSVEYAIYTFMVEFGRSPYSLDELRETGHLNVVMTNPYTGGEVVSLTREDYPDGDLIGNIFVEDREEGMEAYVEIWYIRSDETTYGRSMSKHLFLYQSEVDWSFMFGNDLPRDERMISAYCIHAVDALDSFYQRNGRSPEDFEDMYENGDINVHYINPVTGELAVSSEESSAGDFMYRKIGELGYTIIGWGREQPVFFATTEESEEEWFYSTYYELSEDTSGAEEEPVEHEGCPHDRDSND